MPEWRMEEVAPGIFARTGTNPLQPNSGIIVGERGVLVVDSGYSTAAGRDLLADVRRVSSLPVTMVVISHHHFDHSWGNEAFEGAQLIGHENARQMMLGDTSGYKDRMVAYAPTSSRWYGLSPEDLAQQFAETHVTAPESTFTDRAEVDLPGQRVELLHFGAGHTTGDTLVFLPDERVLFGGDLICNHVFPNAMDGDPLHWPAVLTQVALLGANVLVPGHGRAGDRSILEDFGRCLDGLMEQVGEALSNGVPTPRAASEHLRVNDFDGWAGRELLPGTVRSMFRALEQARA
jgi:glyoxylase-like metal-dependent hydrolase (beta-lactamase superfamily II)